MEDHHQQIEPTEPGNLTLKREVQKIMAAEQKTQRLSFTREELQILTERAAALARIASDGVMFDRYIALSRAAADLLEAQEQHGGGSMADWPALPSDLEPAPVGALSEERMTELRLLAAASNPAVNRDLDPERARLRAEGEVEMAKALETLKARGAAVTSHGSTGATAMVEGTPLARLEADHPCPGA